MAFEVPPLPYDYGALEPHIDEQTMRVHHDKHHQAYVDNANAALAGTELDGRSPEQILTNLEVLPEDKQAAVRNNVGGHANHSFFWEIMGPGGGGEPSGALAQAINAKWGSYAAFREAFVKSAVGNFGSGWTWLVGKADGSVDIVNMGAAGTPLTTGDKPLFTVDVWEHAYYIDYRNLRPKFVETFLDKLANWDFAESNFAA
jgi:Fe-Mn family superoxide dismutase